jgi:hypothetical protein
MPISRFWLSGFCFLLSQFLFFRGHDQPHQRKELKWMPISRFWLSGFCFQLSQFLFFRDHDQPHQRKADSRKQRAEMRSRFQRCLSISTFCCLLSVFDLVFSAFYFLNFSFFAS